MNENLRVFVLKAHSQLSVLTAQRTSLYLKRVLSKVRENLLTRGWWGVAEGAVFVYWAPVSPWDDERAGGARGCTIRMHLLPLSCTL